MLTRQAKYTNSVFERKQRRKNKTPSEQVDRFIDSDSEHFLYFPEDKTNIDQRTENLSPDLLLFLVLAGEEQIIRTQCHMTVVIIRVAVKLYIPYKNLKVQA